MPLRIAALSSNLGEGAPVSRMLPPPTRYDPLRLAQAKAAPAPRAIATPPTRFAPPVQHHGPAVIQRAAALGSGVAGAGGPPGSGGMAKSAEAASKSNDEDTLAMKYARTLDRTEAQKWLDAAAVIGSDKKNFSPLKDYIVGKKADCLSIWLVHCKDGVHSNQKNLDWLDLCIAARKDVYVLNPSTVGMGSFVSKKTKAQLLAAKPIKTEHEAGYLLTHNYVWQPASGKLASPK
jgi:hypothetical protein